MPQIKVNEIDQSIYTRVVTDDKVRVMVPGIASFGPGDKGLVEIEKTFTESVVTNSNKTSVIYIRRYLPIFLESTSRKLSLLSLISLMSGRIHHMLQRLLLMRMTGLCSL